MSSKWLVEHNVSVNELEGRGDEAWTRLPSPPDLDMLTSAKAEVAAESATMAAAMEKRMLKRRGKKGKKGLTSK